MVSASPAPSPLDLRPELAPTQGESTDVWHESITNEPGLSPQVGWPRIRALEDLEDRVLLSGNPTVYTVTDLSDSGTDTGSLRYAIIQANANTNPAGSLIQFDPLVFSSAETILLGSILELSETAGPEMIDGLVRVA